MHGFCTVFARFQTVQRVLFGAKYDKECRNYYAKNHVVLRKNGDDSKLPSFETNPRLSLLISGPRVRVPGGAPQQQNPNFFPIGEGFGFFIFFAFSRCGRMSFLPFQLRTEKDIRFFRREASADLAQFLGWLSLRYSLMICL